MTLKILIADDEPDILELIEMCLEDYDVDITKAQDGAEVMQCFEKQKFDLLICDYNMPKLNGGDVYRAMIEKKIKTPFVHCSARLLDVDSIFQEFPPLGAIIKPDVFRGVEDIMEKLKGKASNASQSDSEYSSVGLHLLFKNGKCPADIYIRLSEDKIIKLYNKDDIFNGDDYHKHLNQNSTLFLKREDRETFIKDIQKNIHELILSKEGKDGSKSVEITEQLQSAIKEMGIPQEIQQLTKQHLKQMTNWASKKKGIGDLLAKINKDTQSYLAIHADITTFIVHYLAVKATWNHEVTLFKLSLASFLKDITLVDGPFDDAEKIQDFNDKQDKATHEGWKKYKEHPTDAMKKINLFEDIPPDIDRLIVEHHELPDGSGFPRKIGVNYISSLGHILSLATCYADYAYQKIVNDEKPQINEFIEKFHEKFDRSQTRKHLEALKELET